MFPEWITDRGAAVSFGLIALVLMAAVGPVARALRVPGSLVDEQWWWGGAAFLVVARVTAVALAAPGLILDPMVVIRFTDDLAPIPGAIAALAVVWLRTRRRAEAAAAWAAAVAGLTITAATYGLACPLRESCHGAPGGGPFAFPMHGLTEPRFATPFMEGVLLLLVQAVALRLLDRWDAGRVGWALLAGAAGTRLLLLPITARGFDLVEGGVLAVVVIAGAGMAARGVRAAREPAPV